MSLRSRVAYAMFRSEVIRFAAIYLATAGLSFAVVVHIWPDRQTPGGVYYFPDPLRADIEPRERVGPPGATVPQNRVDPPATARQANGTPPTAVRQVPADPPATVWQDAPGDNVSPDVAVSAGGSPREQISNGIIERPKDDPLSQPKTRTAAAPPTTFETRVLDGHRNTGGGLQNAKQGGVPSALPKAAADSSTASINVMGNLLTHTKVCLDEFAAQIKALGGGKAAVGAMINPFRKSDRHLRLQLVLTGPSSALSQKLPNYWESLDFELNMYTSDQVLVFNNLGVPRAKFIPSSSPTLPSPGDRWTEMGEQQETALIKFQDELASHISQCTQTERVK